jgi:steroid 5-alpha reductase family enzyme
MSTSLDAMMGVPFEESSYPARTADIGLLTSTLRSSFCLNSGLSIATYVASRAANRVEGKDWLWPSGQVINAWWNAVGRRMYYGHISFCDALRTLSWSDRLLLGGVSAWGLRLFYRIASRSLSRRKDDPRYEEAKQKPGFWNRAFWTLFLPEALFQTVISLPFTTPFRTVEGAVQLAPEHATCLRALAVGLFSAGFALEVIADVQVEQHRKEHSDLYGGGVWSMVRHPK